MILEWAKLDAAVITQAQLENPAPTRPPAPEPVSRLPAAGPPKESEFKIIQPDVHGFIDATQPDTVRPVEDPPNPFRKRWRPPEIIREATLSATGVLVAARSSDSCVCLNGRLCSPGETFEGFTLWRITADEIELRRRHTVLRLSLDHQPWRLRMSKS